MNNKRIVILNVLLVILGVFLIIFGIISLFNHNFTKYLLPLSIIISVVSLFNVFRSLKNSR